MPTTVINGSTLHYLDEGTGPTLVLLHAFPLAASMWDDQIAPLSRRHRVIAPDFRGFGRSDAPPDPTSMSISDYADDTAELLTQLGLADAVFAGLSMGGYVTFALLRHHPHRVRAVVLADTRSGADTPEGASRRTAQQERIAAGDATGVLDVLIGGLLAEATHRDRPEVVARVRSIMDTASPEGIIGALEAMKNRPDATPDLASFGRPALVIVGRDDALSPPEVAEAMAAGLADARVVVIDGAGHLSNIEAPLAFTDAVGGFLDRLEP